MKNEHPQILKELLFDDDESVTRFITPEQAEALIPFVHPDNRDLRIDDVKQLANAITLGEWAPSANSITVTKTGWIIDGQHTLHAIVWAGRTIKVTFHVGANDTDMKYHDSGRLRSLSQALAIYGLDTRKRMPVILKSMANSLDPNKKVNAVVGNRFYAVYQDAIDFARQHVPTGARAAVKGAVARAYYYYEDRELLKRFIQFACFADHQRDPELNCTFTDRDKIPSLLRAKLQEAKGKGGGRDLYQKLYRWTEYALEKYRQGGTIRHLRQATKELYPLIDCPEEIADMVIIGD